MHPSRNPQAPTTKTRKQQQTTNLKTLKSKNTIRKQNKRYDIGTPRAKGAERPTTRRPDEAWDYYGFRFLTTGVEL